jgi:8-oxo-dGTP pyrophosphatase MutT (NUDIX family)
MANYETFLEVPNSYNHSLDDPVPAINEEEIRADLELLTAPMDRYASVVDPLLEEIDLARAEGRKVRTLPNYLGTERTHHIFEGTDASGKSILIRTIRPETSSPSYSTEEEDERFFRVAAPLLKGRGNPQLEQLQAIDTDRKVMVSTNPPGTSMWDISARQIARIKAEHIEGLTLTLNDMRRKGLHPHTIRGVLFDPEHGFSFRGYSMGEGTMDNQGIMANTVKFLHWALADHRKLEGLITHKADGMRIPDSAFKTTGLRGMARALKLRTAADILLKPGPMPNYYDTAQPLPEDELGPQLITLDKLSETPAPAGASRYVRTSVHTVLRNNGSTGYQVVNDLNPGVSLLALDVVQGHAYGVFVDQQRYPHTRLGENYLSLEQAARARRIGRWSREIISGGVELGETEEEALAREAAEEAGIMNMDLSKIERIYPELKSSVSINNQAFNLYVGKIGDGMWNPELAFPEAEEGNMPVGAYRLDTAVPEMIRRGIIFEMSAVAAINGLYRTRYHKYL